MALINTGVEPSQAGGAVRGRKGPLDAYKEPSEAGVARGDKRVYLGALEVLS